MDNPFETLPERSNGDDVDAGWFNLIRTTLINFFGTETLAQDKFDYLNDSSATAITGLIFDLTKTTSANILFESKRGSLMEPGGIRIWHDGTDWDIDRKQSSGDDTGLTFTINAVGQVLLAVTNAVDDGVLKFKADTFNV